MKLRSVLLPISCVAAAALAIHAAHGKEPDRTLRVCADPANLPFSNDKEQGYENEVAKVVAKELGAKLEYTWFVQRRGFFRNTLNAGTCDVVIGAPKGLDMARTTKPWFRSTFALVTRKDRHLEDLRSIDDPRLRTMTIGVPLVGDDDANPPPIHALAKRGVVTGIRGYHLYGEIGREVPAAIEAVEKGDVDVAILWGPVAGAGARKAKTPLVVTPLAEETDGDLPFAFSFAMATRKRDAALAKELDQVIDRRGDALRAILRSRGVPLLPLSTEVKRAP